MTVADRFVALPARGVADKCAVFGRPPVRRMRYLRACSAVTRFAIVFVGRPLSKNHGCCPDAAGFNLPKSWADVFHGSPPERALYTVKHPLSRKVLRFLARSALLQVGAVWRTEGIPPGRADGVPCFGGDHRSRGSVNDTKNQTKPAKVRANAGFWYGRVGGSAASLGRPANPSMRLEVLHERMLKKSQGSS